MQSRSLTPAIGAFVVACALAPPPATANDNPDPRFTDGGIGARASAGGLLVRQMQGIRGFLDEDTFAIVGVDEFGPIQFANPGIPRPYGAGATVDTDGGLAQLTGMSGPTRTGIEASITTQRATGITTLSVEYYAILSEFLNNIQAAFDLGWEFGTGEFDALSYSLRSYLNAEITLDAPAFVNLSSEFNRSTFVPLFGVGGSNPGQINPANIPNWQLRLEPGTYTLDFEILRNELDDDTDDILGAFDISFRAIPAPTTALPLVAALAYTARRRRTP